MTTARIEWVYFTIHGVDDTELHRKAREVLADFSMVPHGYRIRAEAKFVNNEGDVIMWSGDVTAWPEEP